MKQYKIKYLFDDVTRTYYMSMFNESDHNLSQEDISYSARTELAKFLRTEQFTIISIIEM